MDWFTSDTHFNHRNIVIYCSRPFATMEDMNREMVERWNARVQPDDTVYHLGDFAMGKTEEWPALVRALRGRKILVLGNHDRTAKRMIEMGFDEAHESLIYPGHRILLQHHPQYGYDPTMHVAHFCGHVHEKWASRKTTTGGLVINVGVDQNDFRPSTLEEIFARPLRPGVFDNDKLLQCRVCPRTVAPTSKFLDGCPKCGSRETAPFIYGEPT